MHIEYFWNDVQETNNVGFWETETRDKLFIVYPFVPFELWSFNLINKIKGKQRIYGF